MATNTKISKPKVYWTNSQTDLLVGFWKENYDHLIGVYQRDYWRMVSVQVSDIGPPRLADECKQKITNMTKTYKQARDTNNRTGEAANFPKYYYDFDEILGTRDCMNVPQLKQTGFETNTTKQKHSIVDIIGSPSSSSSTTEVSDESSIYESLDESISPVPRPSKRKFGNLISSQTNIMDKTTSEQYVKGLLNKKENVGKENSTEKENKAKRGKSAALDELIELQKNQIADQKAHVQSQCNFLKELIEAQNDHEAKARQRELEAEERNRDKDRLFMLELAKIFKYDTSKDLFLPY